MPQSLAQVYLHIAFSTKDRIPFLKDRELRNKTHAYIAGICKHLDSPTLKVNGPEDHVHIACRLSRKHTIADLLQKLKEKSSKWIKKKDGSLSDFYWQGGFGAFSVSPSHLPALLEYIASQSRRAPQKGVFPR